MKPLDSERDSAVDSVTFDSDRADRRRRDPRAPTSGTTTLNWSDAGRRFYTVPAALKDLSESGVAVETTEPTGVGQRVTLDLAATGLRWGQVRHTTWRDGTCRIGVELDSEVLDFLD